MKQGKLSLFASEIDTGKSILLRAVRIIPTVPVYHCYACSHRCMKKPLFLWKLHAVVLAMNNFELDTAVNNYGLPTLRRLNIANEPCVVAIQWKLVLLKIRKRKWFKYRVNSYSNSDATFNVMELCIERSGDMHPITGRSDNCTSEITVRI